MINKPSVVVIVGPTAVGKTKLSIDLAKRFNGEIISADSMQIYKYMNIGTAKPTLEEMDGTPHYLIDQIDPKEEFSVAQYKELAQKYIEDILNKGKLPIIVGGTGLYVNSLIYNISFSQTVSDKEYRNELQNIAHTKGNQYLYNMLKEVDEAWACKLHFNDTKRIIRALEVYKCTGKTMSYHNSISRLDTSPYNYIIIGLTTERKLLYDRINARVDLMLEKGLVDEVKSLIKNGYTRQMTSMQGIGYKEIIDYLEGKYSLEEAIDIIKRESRRYAKRQMTWFKRVEGLKWVDITNVTYSRILDDLVEYILEKK